MSPSSFLPAGRKSVAYVFYLLPLFFVLLLKFSSADAQVPAWEWAKSVGSIQDDEGRRVAVDNQGNSYVTGYFSGTATFGTTTLISSGSIDAYLLKVGAQGNVIWAKKAGGTLSDGGRDVAVDPDGNLVLTGWFSTTASFGTQSLTSNGGQDAFVAKYDPEGNLIWLRKYGSTSDDEGRKITFDGQGRIWLTGNFSSSISFGGTNLVSAGSRDAYLTMLGPDGQALWARRIGGTDFDYGLGVAVDGFGNAYCAGYFSGTVSVDGFQNSTTLISTAASRDIFLVKFNPAGQAFWARKAGGAGPDDIFGMSCDLSGNAVLTGRFSGTALFDTTQISSAGSMDCFVARYNRHGDLSWVVSAGGAGPDLGADVSTDGFGNTYCVGYFQQTGSFGSTNLVSQGSDDIFVAKYQEDGQLVWAKRAGGSGSDLGHGIAIDGSGNAYVTGIMSANAAFDNVTLPGSGGQDIYFAKLGNTPLPPPAIPLTRISGRLFQETNSNCLFDTSESGLAGRVVKASPGNHYALSDAQGNYTMLIPVNTTPVAYQLQALPFSTSGLTINPICSTSNTLSVLVGAEPDTLSGYDFGYTVLECNQLEVQISSNRRRRCFRNQTVVQYTNIGVVPALNSYVEVEFPHWVRPLMASQNHVAVSDSVWRFDLGNLEGGATGTIRIADSVLCGNLDILGRSQCTVARIFPESNCPTPGNWSGAEITVSGECLNGLVRLGLYNRTAVNMPDSVDYWVFLDSIQVRSAKIKLNAGDSTILSVDPMGFGVHLAVNQVAHHPYELFTSTTVELCSDTIEFYPKSLAEHFALPSRPNSKTQCLDILGSYDPNDKQVFPRGFTNQNIIPPGTKLEYLIRFQNSGTDTAFTVVVVDTLDGNLRPESISMGSVSHPYSFRMETIASGKTVLKWVFSNILLPDSNVNEVRSHGFIQFRISPKANLPLGTEVHNEAGIFFDFNPPIATNLTKVKYDVLVFEDTSLANSVQIVTRIPTIVNVKDETFLYPNPVTNGLGYCKFHETGFLEIMDMQGKLVFKAALTDSEKPISIPLSPGFYQARIRGSKTTRIQKLVVQ